MTPAQLALARRLAEHTRLVVSAIPRWVLDPDPPPSPPSPVGYRLLPDLTDWPTVGALLGMLIAGPIGHDGAEFTIQSRWADNPREDWNIRWGPLAGWSASTPGEAVALALLAAWGEK